MVRWVGQSFGDYFSLFGIITVDGGASEGQWRPRPDGDDLMSQLRRDPDNPSVVCVYPQHGTFMWFKLDPRRNLIYIQGRGQRETLDMDILCQAASLLLDGNEFCANV